MTDLNELFPVYPDDAAVWIYTADKMLDKQEQELLLTALEPFLASWTSHERVVIASATILEDRFLTVAAHIPGGDVSGCGVDKLVHAVESAGRTLGVSWHGGLDIAYRDANGNVSCISRPSFRELASRSVIDGSTPVFDTSINLVGQLRRHGIERTAGASWHGKVFRLDAGVEA